MSKAKREFRMMKGDSEKADADKHVGKARETAVKELGSAKGGFAVFYSKTDRKGKQTGIQQIVAGAMSIEDTINMAASMREMSDVLMEQLIQGFEEMSNGRK